MMEKSLLFQHPCNIFISGPSGSGKTEFVKRMLEYKEDLFLTIPDKVVWCYKEWQNTYALLQESYSSYITFIQGMPENDDDLVFDVTKPHLGAVRKPL